jgi:hypothetical protein
VWAVPGRAGSAVGAEVGPRLCKWTILDRTSDLFGVNCAQQGLMELHALVRCLVTFRQSWFGFQSCCTSLLYRGRSG